MSTENADHEMWNAAMGEDGEAPEQHNEESEGMRAFEKLMKRAAEGPNRAKAKEFLSDDKEPTETETVTVNPPGLVGTMSAGTTGITSTHHSSYPTHASIGSGGVVGPGSPMYYPTTTTPGVWTTPLPSTMAPPAKPVVPTTAQQVPMPSKFTPKVLLAFLDEREGMEDELVWAAHLLADHFEMRLEDGEIKLVMEFSLRDHYGNNPAKD